MVFGMIAHNVSIRHLSGVQIGKTVSSPQPRCSKVAAGFLAIRACKHQPLVPHLQKCQYAFQGIIDAATKYIQECRISEAIVNPRVGQCIDRRFCAIALCLAHIRFISLKFRTILKQKSPSYQLSFISVHPL